MNIPTDVWNEIGKWLCTYDRCKLRMLSATILLPPVRTSTDCELLQAMQSGQNLVCSECIICGRYVTKGSVFHSIAYSSCRQLMTGITIWHRQRLAERYAMSELTGLLPPDYLFGVCIRKCFGTNEEVKCVIRWNPLFHMRQWLKNYNYPNDDWTMRYESIIKKIKQPTATILMEIAASECAYDLVVLANAHPEGVTPDLKDYITPRQIAKLSAECLRRLNL